MKITKGILITAMICITAIVVAFTFNMGAHPKLAQSTTARDTPKQVVAEQSDPRSQWRELTEYMQSHGLTQVDAIVQLENSRHYMKLIEHMHANAVTQEVAIKQFDVSSHYMKLIEHVQTHDLTEEAAIKQFDVSSRYEGLLEIALERNFTDQHAIDRMKYVVTRQDCHQYLAEYMQTNNLTAEDVAKILDRRIGTVKRILQRKALPTDEMIARVEAMLIMGPPERIEYNPMIAEPFGKFVWDFWDLTKLHWPFVDDDSEFIIDQTIERSIKQ